MRLPWFLRRRPEPVPPPPPPRLWWAQNGTRPDHAPTYDEDGLLNDPVWVKSLLDNEP